jgi:hypothetical protein
VKGLANAITRALSHPTHYADLGRGARQIAARFTLAAHLSKLETTLETVLGTTPGTPAVSGCRS